MIRRQGMLHDPVRGTYRLQEFARAREDAGKRKAQRVEAIRKALAAWITGWLWFTRRSSRATIGVHRTPDQQRAWKSRRKAVAHQRLLSRRMCR